MLSVAEPPALSCANTDQVYVSENGTHIVTSNSSDKCRFVILRVLFGAIC